MHVRHALVRIQQGNAMITVNEQTLVLTEWAFGWILA